MEEEAAKLKEMQKEAEDSLLSPSHGKAVSICLTKLHEKKPSKSTVKV